MIYIIFPLTLEVDLLLTELLSRTAREHMAFSVHSAHRTPHIVCKDVAFRAANNACIFLMANSYTSIPIYISHNIPIFCQKLPILLASAMYSTSGLPIHVCRSAS